MIFLTLLRLPLGTTNLMIIGSERCYVLLAFYHGCRPIMHELKLYNDKVKKTQFFMESTVPFRDSI